jgi:hypothetical protein
MSLKTRLFQLLVVLSLAIGMQAQGRANCSNATLRGTYGLHATGSIIGVGDFASVGRFTYDGQGNFTGKIFGKIGGNTVEPPAFTGTYSVSPDCIMSDTWGAPINATHVSVIVDEGKGYFLLLTSGSGETISGEARRQ